MYGNEYASVDHIIYVLLLKAHRMFFLDSCGRIIIYQDV